MLENDFFSLFTDPLNALAVDYMVTGSSVVIAYGEPRLTNDIDLVISLRPQQAIGLIVAFPPEDYYCPPEEVLRTEVERRTRGHFNIIHHRTGLKADVYLCGTDNFLKWGLENRKQHSISSHTVFFAPLEYVIVKKLEFYQEGKSEKHLRDVRGLLAVSGDLVDQSILDYYINEFHLHSAWHSVKVE